MKHFEALAATIRFRIGSNIWGILYLKAIRYGEELTLKPWKHVTLLVEIMSSHYSPFHMEGLAGLDRSSSSDFRTSDSVRRRDISKLKQIGLCLLEQKKVFTGLDLEIRQGQYVMLMGKMGLEIKSYQSINWLQTGRIWSRAAGRTKKQGTNVKRQIL